jgi:hypothetical protein
MKKNETGLGAIQGLLILVIVIFIGLIGWQAHHNKNNSNNSTSSKVNTGNQLQNKKTYKSAQGKFSVQYPSSWSAVSKGCGSSVILLGGNSDAVGKCGTENIGQMSISSNYGDNTGIERLKNGYSLVNYQETKVQGITGFQETGVAGGQTSTQFGGGALPDGTKVVKYVFFTQKRTYVAIYIQRMGYPDVLRDFNLMVTKNLQFK